MSIDTLIADLERVLPKATPGPWTASQYMDTPEWGIINNSNRIVVGLSSRISLEDARHIALCSPDNIAVLLAEVKRLREDAERWRWFDEFAQASVPKKGGGTQRVAEWLAFEALWEHGSRSAAIDAARKHPGTAEQGEQT